MATLKEKLKSYLMAVALGTCSWAAQGATAHQHSGPAPVPFGVAGFDIYRDGKTLHLLVAEFNEVRHSRVLTYRQSNDDGRTWSAVVRVNGEQATVHDIVRGNDPQIAARGNTVLAVWTEKGTGYGGSGPLTTAVSRDGGRTWRAGANPADDKSTDGHAYIDVIAGTDAFDLVWLDGRDGSQGLRHAQSNDALNWSRNTTIQKGTCECCWNTLARTEDALMAMLRGKDPRDMLLITKAAHGKWERNSTVGSFGWDFKGCPHTGGGLVSSGVAKAALHAVVWTGAAAAQGVHYLKSTDRGRTWSPPHRVGSTDARRADIAAGAGGKVLVTWDQLEATGAHEAAHGAVYASESRDDGQRWWKPIRLSDKETDASYPRVVATSDGFLVLWTQAALGRGPVLKMKAVRLAR